MRRLKVLALSDLHLGEPEGLLRDRGVNIIDVVVAKVSELARGGEGLEDGIEELILIGDIADLSEAREERAYTNTKVFLTALLEKVLVDKIIYVPGNHDHHLWVEILKDHYGKDNYEECTPKTELAIKDQDNLKKALTKNWFLPDFYKGVVEIHYPFYHLRSGGGYFIFDHGHLFSSILTRIAGSVSNLEEMEKKTQGFMEAIWFREKTSPWTKIREWGYDWSRWLFLRAKYPTRGVSFKEDATPVFDDGLRERIVKYLEGMVKVDEAAMKDFHLVFGHTHHGGRVLKGDRKVRVNGSFITIWNTGGWLVPSEAFSPDAYIFYIEQGSDGSGRPGAYKLVAKKGDEDGDYDRSILKEIVEGIG